MDENLKVIAKEIKIKAAKTALYYLDEIINLMKIKIKESLNKAIENENGPKSLSFLQDMEQEFKDPIKAERAVLTLIHYYLTTTYPKEMANIILNEIFRTGEK